MTTAEERTRALLEVRDFLREMVSTENTPGVPDAVRHRAKALLRHYPTESNLHLAHLALPSLFAPLVGSSRARSGPLHRLVAAARVFLDALRGRPGGAALDGSEASVRALERNVALTVELLQHPSFSAIAAELEAQMRTAAAVRPEPGRDSMAPASVDSTEVDDQKSADDCKRTHHDDCAVRH